jgi:hypothetical protein
MGKVKATRAIIYKTQRMPKDVVENESTLLPSAEMHATVQLIASVEATPDYLLR